MAYDKVVDSSVLDAGLKQIADAIREKSGSTGTLSFPTAMAEAILAIESGGGLGGDELQETSGSFTLASETSTYTFAHGLGKIPKFVHIHATNIDRSIATIQKSATASQKVATIIYCYEYAYIVFGKYSGSSFSAICVRNAEAIKVDDQTITCDVTVIPDSTHMKSWYGWVAKG